MKHIFRIALLSLFCLATASLLLASCRGSEKKPTDTVSDTLPSTDAATDTSESVPDTEPVVESEASPVTETETQPETETETEAPSWIPPEEFSVSEAANVALGCPVITNSAQDGSNQNLTDGKNTAWNTGYSSAADRRTFPYEAVIDLTRSYAEVRGIVISPSTAAPSAIYDQFRVEVSEDGITYAEVATHADATVAESGALHVPFANATAARFVRITSTDLGERQSYGLEIAEVEVMATITSYDALLPNKRALVMQPGATDALTAVYRLPSEENGTVSFFSSNDRIVTVDEKTGKVTAHCNGEATLYVTDGKNATPIPVTVHTPDPSYRVATFYLANHGENTREVFALLKESGITFLENCRVYDTYGNLTTEYLRVMANDFGLTVSLADPDMSRCLSLSDEEIRAVAAKYKNLPGYGGLYLVDEPLDPRGYARVYRAIIAEDPFCQPHLNLFPPMGQISDYHGYVTDWVALTGGDILRSLSYDNYPYGLEENTFHEWVYDSMNEIRKSALLYNNLNTGYYIHSMGIHNAYRVPTDSEILYHAAVGVAYGMKDFKHFVWFTPPYSGSGEHFITGILTPDMQKSEIFEGVKTANAMLHTLSPILANTDAVEVYHFRGRGGTDIPDGFCVTSTKVPIILSVLVDRTTGQQYLVVVNKRMNQNMDITLKVQDGALTELCDVTSGEAVPVTISNGKLTLSMTAGGLCVLKLPEGYDARMERTVNDGTSESLLSGIGASVSSTASGGKYAYMLNDGNRTGSGWSTNYDADTAWLVYDLKTEKIFNRVDIYPLEGRFDAFPRALTVEVSDDGVTYRAVASAKDIDLGKWGSLTFEDTAARFIRITVNEMNTVGKPVACIGELEVYKDTGSIPAMPTFSAPAGSDDDTPHYFAPSEAGVVGAAYDAVMIDGDMKVNGNAAAWLQENGHTVTAESYITFYGWIGFSTSIQSFGYVVDDGEPIWNTAFKTHTEDGVLAAGGAHASRFQIKADVSALSAGEHTLSFLVKLTDGTLVILNRSVTVHVP